METLLKTLGLAPFGQTRPLAWLSQFETKAAVTGAAAIWVMRCGPQASVSAGAATILALCNKWHRRQHAAATGINATARATITRRLSRRVARCLL
jgi:hypothetical protein